MTILNMANAYMIGPKDFTKSEEMYRLATDRLALDGFQKSLRRDHEVTKRCARNLARLYLESAMNDKDKMGALSARYPHLVQGDASIALSIRAFIA